ncbi:MAG: 4Fe-4S binding protein [Candidatus Thorarchaeota archaeon]|jgi:pyruvate ferredoxin oxidoreductase delta subunit
MSEKFNEIPIAGNIVEPGNSKKYLTGGWRAEKPIHTDETCLWVKNGTCGRCWIYCPDMAVVLGCGICANECPTDSIKMVSE